MQQYTAAIKGVECFVPDFRLSNKLLEELVETNEEWITSRTGIQERRILKGKQKGMTEMAIPAVRQLLTKTKTNPKDIDLIICATVTPDMVFPASANIIADKTGLSEAFGFDLNAACSGFIYALSTASQFIQCGTYKKIIVVGADKMSSIIDYEDRKTCVIFGDAAGAVLMERSEDADLGIKDFWLKSDGAGAEHLHQKAGGSKMPPTHQTVDDKLHYVYQEGKQVFKFAVTHMADASRRILERNNLKSEDIDWLVPHQANKRIIDATKNALELPDEKVLVNIERYGNTTNATIPLCLWEWESKFKKGDKIILAAFGGGFTWGAIYLKWAYDSK
ncbi:MAG: beta-ketoacyl-ACP synthase III [Chitinophagales bacterium]